LQGFDKGFFGGHAHGMLLQDVWSVLTLGPARA